MTYVTPYAFQIGYGVPTTSLATAQLDKLDTRIQLDKQMHSAFVEFSVGEFLNIVNVDADNQPPATKVFRLNVDSKSELSMYSGICEGLENSLPDGKPRCPIKDTSEWSSKHSVTDASPSALKEITIDVSEWPENACKSLGVCLDYVATPSWALKNSSIFVLGISKSYRFERKPHEVSAAVSPSDVRACGPGFKCANETTSTVRAFPICISPHRAQYKGIPSLCCLVWLEFRAAACAWFLEDGAVPLLSHRLESARF
ncbi:hypothetical protein A0H81_06522 [Grifola frondosa]|uniref:Uncharacterized protein n=1 Tax=Grifola frondosa TaxID=5627 RepID=A0A1C7M9M5_GRIFR|nr:hypothetical protein A0H81_06522 [Grifola frondosa]